MRWFAIVLAMWSTVATAATYDTENFRVNALTQEIAEKVGHAAELYRKELAVYWLGRELPGRWTSRCSINVEISDSCSGSTTFGVDNNSVFGWEMKIKGPPDRVIDSSLKHEVCHTIFHSYIRRSDVHRWWDEGAAMQVEHSSEQRNYDGYFSQSARKFTITALLSAQEYPGDVGLFYAQSYLFTKFLIESRDQRTFMAFVRDKYDSGRTWEQSLDRWYNFAKLENASNACADWMRWRDTQPDRLAKFQPKFMEWQQTAGKWESAGHCPPCPPCQPMPSNCTIIYPWQPQYRNAPTRPAQPAGQPYSGTPSVGTFVGGNGDIDDPPTPDSQSPGADSAEADDPNGGGLEFDVIIKDGQIDEVRPHANPSGHHNESSEDSEGAGNAADSKPPPGADVSAALDELENRLGERLDALGGRQDAFDDCLDELGAAVGRLADAVDGLTPCRCTDAAPSVPTPADDPADADNGTTKGGGSGGNDVWPPKDGRKYRRLASVGDGAWQVYDPDTDKWLDIERPSKTGSSQEAPEEAGDATNGSQPDQTGSSQEAPDDGSGTANASQPDANSSGSHVEVSDDPADVQPYRRRCRGNDPRTAQNASDIQTLYDNDRKIQEALASIAKALDSGHGPCVVRIWFAGDQLMYETSDGKTHEADLPDTVLARIASLESKVNEPFDVQLFSAGRKTERRAVQPHGGYLPIDIGGRLEIVNDDD